MTALITGGTSGIGAAFATALASRGDDLVLVARDADRLARTAAALEAAHGVSVEVLPADLSVREQVQLVADRIADDSRPVDLVINNAGFGLHSHGDDTSTDERGIAVMVTAVYVLSRACVTAMTRRGHGRIINVASTAGWIMLGHYSAIKAYVTVLTESLAVELTGTSVTATALEPGWVHTEFHERAGIESSKLPSVVWVDPDRLVAECLADAEAGKPVSIPTKRWRAAIVLARLVPRPAIAWVSGKLRSSRE